MAKVLVPGNRVIEMPGAGKRRVGPPQWSDPKLGLSPARILLSTFINSTGKVKAGSCVSVGVVSPELYRNRCVGSCVAGWKSRMRLLPLIAPHLLVSKLCG